MRYEIFKVSSKFFVPKLTEFSINLELGIGLKGLKVVELSPHNPNIIFNLTFEYENEFEFGKVGNKNKNEFEGYQNIRKQTDSIGNLSKTVGIRKTKMDAPRRN